MTVISLELDARTLFYALAYSCLRSVTALVLRKRPFVNAHLFIPVRVLGEDRRPSFMCSSLCYYDDDQIHYGDKEVHDMVSLWRAWTRVRTR